ncbi:MFS transporter [Chitinibacteraceae bacterium HSL-7]
MTTIVVTHKNGQVAIAADSQSTFGETRLPPSLDVHWDKIFHAHDSYFAICGSAAHDLVLQAALAKAEGLDFSSRAAIFESFRTLHPLLKEEFFLKTDEDEGDPYESSQMIVLIANTHGIFGVFSFREVYAFERFWAIGSGRDYALGAMHALYDTLDAPALAQAGIEAGCAFDIASCLPMTLYTLPVQHKE